MRFFLRIIESFGIYALCSRPKQRLPATQHEICYRCSTRCADTANVPSLLETVRMNFLATALYLTDFTTRLVTRLLTSIPSSNAHARKHLEPIFTERLDKIKEYGFDYPGKPVRAVRL